METKGPPKTKLLPAPILERSIDVTSEGFVESLVTIRDSLATSPRSAAPATAPRPAPD